MDALYDQYAGSLFGIISRILPSKQIAEDALQVTMLKVWNNIGSYDSSSGSLYTWMSTIARNTSIDQRRLKSFQHHSKTEQLDSIVYSKKVILSDNSEIDVGKLLSGLDEKLKIVLEYAYLRGYTHKEIAEALDLPLGTVKTRLRNAILVLRDELKNEKALFIGGLGLITLLLLFC